MDLRKYNMFRIVKENCYSASFLPRANHHGQNGLMWAKDEIIQLTYFAGGDLYIAVPIGLNPNKDEYSQHIWKREFRGLTERERMFSNLPKILGEGINDFKRTHYQIPKIYNEADNPKQKK